MKVCKIGEKKFTHKDQINFAKISKDYNPIHVDPLEARRLISGGQIVHGVNLLLTSLNFLYKREKKLKFNKINCQFLNPAFINEKINFLLIKSKKNFSIEIKNNFSTLTYITLENVPSIKQENFNVNKTKINKIISIKHKKFYGNFTTDPKNFYYQINLNNFKFSKNYKNIKKVFNVSQIKSLLSLSYFVGMIYPGLNSILSSLEIFISKKKIKSEKINLHIKKLDKRINLARVSFSESLCGEIRTFFHSGKINQPSINKIKKNIKKMEFFGTSSLVIGGSRGLGELTAKMLASGGGKVSITYSRGMGDAINVKNRINAVSKKSCKVLQLNVLLDDLKNKLKEYTNYDFIFYYPTPKILANNSKKFNHKIFKIFNNYYVNKFKIICEFLEKKIEKKQTIFFPSTIFIDEKTNNFKEYIKSKLMAEKMIYKLNNDYSKLKIISKRLPILQTDQNSGISFTRENKNIQTLLPILRNMMKEKYDY